VILIWWGKPHPTQKCEIASAFGLAMTLLRPSGFAFGYAGTRRASEGEPPDIRQKEAGFRFTPRFALKDKACYSA